MNYLNPYMNDAIKLIMLLFVQPRLISTNKDKIYKHIVCVPYHIQLRKLLHHRYIEKYNTAITNITSMFFTTMFLVDENNTASCNCYQF